MSNCKISSAHYQPIESFQRAMTQAKNRQTTKKKGVYTKEQCGKGCMPMTPTKKPFQKKETINLKVQELVSCYLKLIVKLKQQKIFYQTLLHKEKDKLEDYYTKIFEHIVTSRNQALLFINDRIEKTNQQFSLQIWGLKHKIFLLENSNIQSFDKEQASLNKQKIFQIDIFQIKTANLDEFKTLINPFLLQVAQNETKIESDQQTIDFSQRQKDILQCDQNLSEKSTIGKHKKYNISVEDIICQQNQSKESSMNIELYDEH